MRLFYFICVFICLPLTAFPHNGKVSYAYPIDKIHIDGSLDDWPSYLPRYSMGELATSELSGDFKGYFMAGYNLRDQVLYVAVEIAGNSNENAGGSRLNSHLLYIDPEHSGEKGSGVVLFIGSQTEIDIWKAENGWDPYNQNTTSENAELSIQHNGNKTVYEWKIQLGESIQLNKSLGLDHEIQVADRDGAEVITHRWGPGNLKNWIPSRLGDVVLVETGTTLAPVSGSIAWSESSDETLPSKVRITSAGNNGFWVQADVDSMGNYSIELPDGSYKVQSGFKTTDALGFTSGIRLDEYSFIEVDVTDADRVIADTLKISLYDRPDFLIPEEGLLFNYNESNANQVDHFVEVCRQYYNIPGVVLALVKDGEVVYNKAFGTRNTITGAPVTLDTIFETASISKAVFAFAVHRLVEKGVLDPDRPLFEYLPFENIASDERSKLITARMVLSHQTGLPNWAWGGPYGWENGDTTELLFTPGDRFEYSGEGYEYLKRVIEKITGKDIEVIMNEEVYQVMNMNETSLSVTPQVTERVSLGHQADLPMFWSIQTRPWVAGSMYSTTADLSKYMVGLMNRIGLTDESYEELFSPEIENTNAFMPFFGGDRVYHSLGFEMQDSPYGMFIHHGGNNGDFQGRFAMLPDEGLGFVLLTNNNAGFQLDLALQEFLITGRNRK